MKSGMTIQSDLQSALDPLRQGRHKAAIKAAKSAMQRHRTQPVFPNIVGIALCGTGRHRDAIGFFRKALVLDPKFHDARKNLAQTLIMLDQLETAEAQLTRLVRDLPEDGGVWYLLAQVRMRTGQSREGIEAADRAIAIDPDLGRTYNLRAILRQTLGQVAESLDDFETALRLNPDDVEALVNISLPLARQTRTDEALRAAERAVELAPDHIGARLRLASQRVEMGETALALKEYGRVIDLAPGNSDALEQLAMLNSAEANRALEPALRSALKQAPKTGEARASLCFGMARIAEQGGDTQGFADWLAQANRLMAQVMPFDIDADAAQADAILSRFPHPVAATPETATPMPVFIVGLPRSGTTLAEAILGAHPQVHPLGERATAGILLGPLIESGAPFDAAAAEAFCRDDRRYLPALPEDCRAYTDKMPENYRLIGFLLTAYPGARIVNLRRDPRDIALSMWRGHFSGSALSYTYDQAAMAHRFNLYARMMAHWHRVFPGRILDLHYEDMVADVDRTSRTLAATCDLDWTPAMARPEESVGQILTMSNTQLRQPVHHRSVGRWRQHADMLTPFIDGLDPDLWPGLA